jgi:hypothetical protein
MRVEPVYRDKWPYGTKGAPINSWQRAATGTRKDE